VIPALRLICTTLKKTAQTLIGPGNARRQWTVVVVVVDPSGEVAVDYTGPHSLAVLGVQTAAADMVDDLG